jgi:hypothetical protein
MEDGMGMGGQGAEIFFSKGVVARTGVLSL